MTSQPMLNSTSYNWGERAKGSMNTASVYVTNISQQNVPVNAVEVSPPFNAQNIDIMLHPEFPKNNNIYVGKGEDGAIQSSLGFFSTDVKDYYVGHVDSDNYLHVDFQKSIKILTIEPDDAEIVVGETYDIVGTHKVPEGMNILYQIIKDDDTVVTSGTADKVYGDLFKFDFVVDSAFNDSETLTVRVYANSVEDTLTRPMEEIAKSITIEVPPTTEELVIGFNYVVIGKIDGLDTVHEVRVYDESEVLQDTHVITPHTQEEGGELYWGLLITNLVSDTYFSFGDTVKLKAVNTTENIESPFYTYNVVSDDTGWFRIFSPQIGATVPSNVPIEFGATYIGESVTARLLVKKEEDTTWEEVGILTRELSGSVWEFTKEFYVTDYLSGLGEEDRIDIRIEEEGNSSIFEETYIFYGEEEEFENVIYVDLNATGANNGTSWTNAFTDLQDALELQSNLLTRPEIWVAGGTYHPKSEITQSSDKEIAFELNPNGAVYGGFEGVESSKDDRPVVFSEFMSTGANLRQYAYPTILDGEVTGGKFHNLVIMNEESKLEGFVIQNAESSADGGGILSEEIGKSYIENVIVYNCVAQSGGGAYLRGRVSPFTVNMTEFDYCHFIGNYATESGAVQCGGHSYPVFRDCSFVFNNAEQLGGAMAMLNVNRPSGADPENINRCVFIGNQASDGGALYVSSGSAPNISNCIFMYNHASGDAIGAPGDGGAMYFIASDPNIYGCTIDSNSAENYCGGVFGTTGTNATIINCIVYNNVDDLGGLPPDYDDSNGTDYRNIDMFDANTCYVERTNFGSNQNKVKWSGDVDNVEGTDPDYSGESPYPLRLASTSHNIDTGTNDYIIGDKDVLGFPRIHNSIIDKGALEFQGVVASFVTISTPDTGITVSRRNLLVEGTNSPGILSVDIEYRIGAGSWTTLVENVNSIGGSFSVVVPLIDEDDDTVIELRAYHPNASDSVFLTLIEPNITLQTPVDGAWVLLENNQFTFNFGGFASPVFDGKTAKIRVRHNGIGLEWVIIDIGEALISEIIGTGVYGFQGTAHLHNAAYFHTNRPTEIWVEVDGVQYENRFIYLYTQM